MNSASDLLAAAAARLRNVGIENPRREARLLWEHADTLALAPMERVGGQGEGASDKAQNHQSPITPSLSPTFVGEREVLFKSLIQRRAAREPFAYISGSKEFWSLPFAVGRGVLVPRPETETLIEEALRRFPDRDAPLRVLDLGTGSGCLLLTLLHEFPNAHGIGIDTSEQALECARQNAERLGVDARCQLQRCSWQEFDGSNFDLVVTNPPYIVHDEIAGLSPEVTRYEPHAALDGGTDGLEAYHALAPRINLFLAPQGVALVELGAGQAESVSRIFHDVGLRITHLAPDLYGHLRCLVSGKQAAYGSARNALETAT